MAQYPVVYAGTKLTSSLFRALIPETAFKASNEAITSTATAQADNDLFCTVVASGVYQLQMAIFVSSPDAGDFEIGFTVPSGTTMRWGAHGIVTSATTSSGDLTAPMKTESETATMSASGGGVVVLVAGMVTVSTTAGVVQTTWMQDVSNASATTVYTGSWMRLTKVA